MYNPYDSSETDIGFVARCETCGRKLAEFRFHTPDGRNVCSRVCMVKGVALPHGSPLAETALSGVEPPIKRVPGSWMVGVECRGRHVRAQVAGIRFSVHVTRLRRAVHHPAAGWIMAAAALLLLLASAFVLGRSVSRLP